MRRVPAILTVLVFLSLAPQVEAARFTAEFYDRFFPEIENPHEALLTSRDQMTETWNVMNTLNSRIVGQAMGQEARKNIETLRKRYERYLADVTFAADAAEHLRLYPKDEKRALRSIVLAEKTYEQFFDILKRFRDGVAMR